MRPFSERELALVRTFADQAVIAIENARLFNETTEALERQTATSEVLRVIGQSPTDAQPVFDVIGPNALRVCGAEACGVILVEDGALHFTAATALRPEWVEAARALFPSPVDAPLMVARVVRERQIVHLADVEQHPEASPEAVALARTMGFRTVLMVPMLRANEAIGVIAVTRQEARLFSPRQVELLQTFADQAVIAIENVRLFRELGARNADLSEALAHQTAASEILHVISGARRDAQPVFEAIGRNAKRLCGGRFGAVFRMVDGLLHLVATESFSSGTLATFAGTFPRAPDRTTVAGRGVLGAEGRAPARRARRSRGDGLARARPRRGLPQHRHRPDAA